MVFHNPFEKHDIYLSRYSNLNSKKSTKNLTQFEKKQLHSLTILLKKRKDLATPIPLSGPLVDRFYPEKGILLYKHCNFHEACRNTLTATSTTSNSSYDILYFMPSSARYLLFHYNIQSRDSCFHHDLDYKCSSILEAKPKTIVQLSKSFNLPNLKKLKEIIVNARAPKDIGAPAFDYYKIKRYEL